MKHLFLIKNLHHVFLIANKKKTLLFMALYKKNADIMTRITKLLSAIKASSQIFTNSTTEF